jgi:WhiB family redox-sensing transcriptional regulator
MFAPGVVIPRRLPLILTRQHLRGDQVSNLASTLALAAADDIWRDQALCRNTDPDLFFPVGTTGYALVAQDHAKQVCGECDVQQACLDYALDTNQDSGIWGGLTEEERRVIRRRRAAAARASRVAS